jgi:hypothetical protein
MTAEVEARIAAVLADVFGERLERLYTHGSFVAGDTFPGFSDLDMVAVVRDGLDVATAARLAERLDLDLSPASYLQVTWVDADAPEPALVPGSFRTLLGGDPPEPMLHTAVSLRLAGASWLSELRSTLRSDIGDWAVSVGRRTRQLRLIVTRTKPSVRAWLTTLGEPPVDTYAAPWGRLVNAARRHDMGMADEIQTLVDALRAEPRDELAIGASALHLLARIAEHVEPTTGA